MYTPTVKSLKRQAAHDLPHTHAPLGLRIAVLAETRYLTHRQPAGVAAALAALGQSVDIVVPEDIALDIGGRDPLPVDGVVARGRSDHLLAMLSALEHVGMPTLNTSSAIADVRDKASMGAALRTAGVPIPPTLLGTPVRLAEHVPDDWYPVLLKPVHGDNSEGLRLIADSNALRQQANGEALAQPYLRTDGTELKLYVVGDDVWAIRRPAAFAPTAVAASAIRTEPVAVTPSLRALALRCGALFGLELYGVDCLNSPDGIVVIEVNDFPNYTDVPDASISAARHITRRLRAAA
jgi:ribosomal protein S6--L-glutamate ligase